MTADSFPPTPAPSRGKKAPPAPPLALTGRPVVLLRMQNYNKVSFGALLGAVPPDLLARVEILIWEKYGPPPPIPADHPTLRLYSFMMPHADQVSAELTRLRAHLPPGHRHFFVVGGAQATTNPETMDGLAFDLVVSGEGEAFFPSLLTDWLADSPPRGRIQTGPEWVDLDRYPGFHPAIGYLPPIEISRGCRFGCNFCAVPRLYRGTLRHRSIPRIVEIAERYREIFPARRRVKFLSSNAFAYGSDGRMPEPAALHDLLEAIRKAGFPQINLGSFPSEVRPDFVTREVLEVVRPYLTNREIVIGLQSGHDERLAAMHRGHTREQAIRALELLREYHFTPHVDFIVGTPGETAAQQREMVTFMEELVNRFGIRIHMHTFMSLPGANWQDQPTRAVIPEVHESLRRLARAGVLDGWWENQIGYARKKAGL